MNDWLCTFRASYRETWNYGGFREYEYIVIANTEDEALGLALEAQPNSRAKDWEIEKIDTSKPHAVETYDREC